MTKDSAQSLEAISAIGAMMKEGVSPETILLGAITHMRENSRLFVEPLFDASESLYIEKITHLTKEVRDLRRALEKKDRLTAKNIAEALMEDDPRAPELSAVLYTIYTKIHDTPARCFPARIVPPENLFPAKWMRRDEMIAGLLGISRARPDQAEAPDYAPIGDAKRQRLNTLLGAMARVWNDFAAPEEPEETTTPPEVPKALANASAQIARLKEAMERKRQTIEWWKAQVEQRELDYHDIWSKYEALLIQTKTQEKETIT